MHHKAMPIDSSQVTSYQFGNTKWYTYVLPDTTNKLKKNPNQNNTGVKKKSHHTFIQALYALG